MHTPNLNWGSQVAGDVSSEQKISQAFGHCGVLCTYSDYQKSHVQTFFSYGLGQNQAKHVPVEPAHLGAPEVHF